MADLVDPGSAVGGKKYFGSDPVYIRYVNINSCATITYIHQTGLWGAHFSRPASKEFVSQTLTLLEANMPKTKPKAVLVIGPIVAWYQNESHDAIAVMESYASKWSDGKEQEYDTDQNLNYAYMNIHVGNCLNKAIFVEIKKDKVGDTVGEMKHWGFNWT
jgi:hypothetical protein